MKLSKKLLFRLSIDKIVRGNLITENSKDIFDNTNNQNSYCNMY